MVVPVVDVSVPVVVVPVVVVAVVVVVPVAVVTVVVVEDSVVDVSVLVVVVVVSTHVLHIRGQSWLTSSMPFSKMLPHSDGPTSAFSHIWLSGIPLHVTSIESQPSVSRVALSTSGASGNV